MGARSAVRGASVREMSTRRRWPGWVYDEGEEPDARFTLANERTFLGVPVTGAPSTAIGERTLLAWQRTAFSLLAGAAALNRLTVDRLGAASVAGLAVTVPLVLWLLLVGAGRSRRRTPDVRRRDGRLPATLSAGIVVVGLTALAAVLVGGSGR